jgi:hypothetical protein
MGYHERSLESKSSERMILEAARYITFKTNGQEKESFAEHGGKLKADP